MNSASAILERLRASRLHLQRAAPDVDALVRANIGLHSTDYASPYLSARARLASGREPVDVSRMFTRLNTGDGLVRLNAMRNTVHVVHVEDVALVSAATGAAVSAVGRRSPGLKELSDADFAAGLDALTAALADGPRSNNELKAALPAQAPHLRYWLIAAMGAGTVIRADGAHARSNRTRYAATAQWVPGFQPGALPAAEARRTLLLRAVHAFGPLTGEDLAWWLPAPKGEVARVLASAGPEVARLEVDGRTYWYPASLAEVASPPREAQGAWILPYEDFLLKGYFDRAWCLAPGLREVVFPQRIEHWAPPAGTNPGPPPHPGANVSGEARPSIWWGGRVVGRWEERGGAVVSQLHVDVGAAGRAEIQTELEGLGRFLTDNDL